MLLKIYDNKKKCVLFNLCIAFISILLLKFSTESNNNDINSICLWVLGSIYLFLFMNFVFRKILINNYLKLNKKKYINIISTLFALLILILLPFRYESIWKNNKMDMLLRNNSIIKIESLAEKNPKSDGYEICIEGIKVNNEDYNLYEIPLVEPWAFVDGRPTINQNINSIIEISLETNSTYEVMIRKNPQAGIVKISIGNNEATFDLYSPDLIQHNKIDLSKVFDKSIDKINLVYKYIFYIIYFIIIWVLSFSVIVTVWKRHKKINEL